MFDPGLWRQRCFHDKTKMTYDEKPDCNADLAQYVQPAESTFTFQVAF
jgi:hypothetical protein